MCNLISHYSGFITYGVGNIGNPISFNGWTLAWQHDRQLASMSKAGRTLNFYYDASGLRTRKADSVEGTTDYTLHGKLITHLKKGGDNLHFFYDAQSRPAMADFNGTIYAYAHNLQGDIVAILDSSNTKVVEYKYDAWGKPTGTTVATGSTSTLTTEYATLAALNPFRYRGYVWDEETGLYYLRSRYYNPEWGRFLNADSILGRIAGLLLHNMYAYCVNNPIMAVDASGRDPWWGLLGIAIAQALIKTRSDRFGERILAHYFYGNMEKLTISNDPEWNNYLLDNANFKKAIDTYARSAIASGQYSINQVGKQISLSVDPNDNGEGGYGTGYQLINGSNVNYGGLCVNGTVTSIRGNRYAVNVYYEFHDYMDAGDYSTDIAAVIISWALVGGCYYYELEINGNLEYEMNY